MIFPDHLWSFLTRDVPGNRPATLVSVCCLACLDWCVRWLIFNASNAFSFRTFLLNVNFCTCFAPSLCRTCLPILSNVDIFRKKWIFRPKILISNVDISIKKSGYFSHRNWNSCQDNFNCCTGFLRECAFVNMHLIQCLDTIKIFAPQR